MAVLQPPHISRVLHRETPDILVFGYTSSHGLILSTTTRSVNTDCSTKLRHTEFFPFT